MSLLSMAVFDTKENNRTSYTKRTLETLLQTVDFGIHRLIVIDNNSCQETKELLNTVFNNFFSDGSSYVIWNKDNIGTASAINLAWKTRELNEHCIKLDNDIEIKNFGWIEQMEETIARDPNIGQIGLKRKDCWESPERTDFYKSELIMLPHQPGEKWTVVEKVNHVMGTCVMHSSALLDKVGYLYQPRLYGFDDSLMSYRTKLAGFYSAFLPHIEIDHIDTGATPYQGWKENHASECWAEYHQKIAEYNSNPASIYYNPYE